MKSNGDATSRMHPDENRRLGAMAPALFRYGGVFGVAALLLSVAVAFFSEGGFGRWAHSYLVNFCFFLSLSLGALFFVLVQHLSRAGWSVVVRRLAEAFSMNLVVLALLFVPILFCMKALFPWMDAEAVAADPLLQWKQPYLNAPFFVLRCVVYFAVWSWFAYYLHKNSVEQDTSSDAPLTLRMERMSAPGLLLFALTVTFASFDLLMSRDPHWFSTIYGVYFFGGSFLGFVSLLPVVLLVLKSKGRLEHTVTREHLHDIGKLMLGFTVFWAYIAFSQFMLIWYAHLPEETGWYFRRQTGQWTGLSLVLLFGHFVIPFLGLLSRYPKRRLFLLAPWGVWILVMHWLDLYWLAMPEYALVATGTDVGRIPLHLLDLLTFVGLGGIYLAGAAFWVRGCSLIPEGDPRLAESLAFENA